MALPYLWSHTQDCRQRKNPGSDNVHSEAIEEVKRRPQGLSILSPPIYEAILPSFYILTLPGPQKL